MPSYPDDADGAVLADLAAQGVDMSQPLDIDFPVSAPDEASANAIASSLGVAGYDSRIVYYDGEPDEDGEVDPDDQESRAGGRTIANVRMIPEYKGIMRIQADLDRIARRLVGKTDGWEVLLDGEAEA